MKLPSKRIYRGLSSATAVVLLILPGCERAEPVTYRVPKEDRRAETSEAPSASPSERAVLPGVARPTSGLEQASDDAASITYSVPDGWEEFSPLGVRKANFLVTDAYGSAEVTILTFPGDIGGNLAIANRWAGQLGLERLTEEDLSEVSTSRSISGLPGLSVRLEGRSERILGAILADHNFTWLFKMQGDKGTVREQEANMKKFLDTVELKETPS